MQCSYSYYYATVFMGLLSAILLVFFIISNKISYFLIFFHIFLIKN